MKPGYMEGYLRIRHYWGEMTIGMYEFFPCTKKDFKKLLKVIHLDFEHEDELREEVKDHLRERVRVCENMIKINTEKHFKCIQTEAKMKRMVEEKKYPNGLPLVGSDLELARKEVKEYRSDALNRSRNVKKYQKEKDNFESLLTLL